MTRPLSVTLARPLTLALLVAAGALTSTLADTPPPALAPGSSFTVPFPEMPPTYASLLDNAVARPQMTVYLPTNYDPGRKHPLLIFLNGGSGGIAGNPSVARALLEERDFVCVALPLFKEKLDPPTPDNGRTRILIHDSDATFAWPLYKTMLAKLEQFVPNIDPAHRVLGGFSNGAHMTAGLVNATDGEAARSFSAFFLVDGGGGIRRFDLLKGKPLMMVCGKWRPNPDPPLAAGVKLTIYRMHEAKHAFPASEYPAVREWLRGAASQ